MSPNRSHRTVAHALLAIAALTCGGCLATSGPPIARYPSPRAALVVIDMQRDFLAADARLPVARDQVAPLLAATNDAIDRARAAGIAVVYVANTFDPGDVIGNLFRNRAALAGSRGSYLDERLTRLDDAPIFVKDTPDAFANPRLDAWLRAHAIDHLVVAGVFADACVYWTVRGALNRRYRVTVLGDAIAAADTDDREDARADLEALGVRVALAADIVRLAGR